MRRRRDGLPRVRRADASPPSVFSISASSTLWAGSAIHRSGNSHLTQPAPTPSSFSLWVGRDHEMTGVGWKMLARIPVWMTAIGTDGAVLVALGLALLPALRSRLRRPILDLAVGDHEPHVRAEWQRSLLQAVVLRIEVRNVGKGDAVAVRAQTRRCWLKPEASTKSGWQEFDVDPMPLRWVSSGGLMTGDPTTVTIAPGSSDFVEVAVLNLRGSPVEHALCSANSRDAFPLGRRTGLPARSVGFPIPLK